MNTRRIVRSLVALAVAGAAAGAPALARAASAPPAPPVPWITISPFKGTPDASPTTQISFLGAPIADISQITVRGSRSGGHGGTVQAYSTGTGGSFVPWRAFTPGETVTVTAVETVSKHTKQIGTQFTVGSPYAIPPKPPVTPPTGSTGTTGATTPPPPPVASYASQPTFHPPTVSVTAPAADPQAGDIFLTPAAGQVQAGAMIVNPAGQMVWFAPSPTNEQD